MNRLEKILGVTFTDKTLLETALTHRSYLNESKAVESNERLEFLGDSVLSLLVSTEIFRRFKKYPEGKLTSLRSALVRAKTLGDLAKKLSLGEFLLMSKGEERSGGRENHSLLADTLEAVLGAIYLDAGLDSVRNFLTLHLFPLIDEVEKHEELKDFKSALQENVQETAKVSPIYRVIGESGPDHNKKFDVGVFLHGRELAVGHGKSKQEAEQEAAKIALQQEKR